MGPGLFSFQDCGVLFLTLFFFSFFCWWLMESLASLVSGPSFQGLSSQ